MTMYDILAKKRDGAELSVEEIRYFVQGFTADKIPEYQASALLMAIYIKGMTKEETAALTREMAHSGNINDLSKINGSVVDKHSSGGVGDTTTLITAPLAAACGVKVAKLSGRGLGHTGGTVDKLEAIPNFRATLTSEEFVKQVNDIGIAVSAQSGQICPADKKLYALRDVTATIGSIPLIASSIMSKKIASGAPAIVLDVKYGSGAFMPDAHAALELAKEMTAIGINYGRKVTVLVTDMNEPLGAAVGNALEVEEAVTILKGGGRGRLSELSILLGAEMLLLGKIAETEQQARRMLEEALRSGAAYEKLKDMVKYQGGNAEVLDDTSLLPKAGSTLEVTADIEGFITKIDADRIGAAAQLLGAGRAVKDDIIDPAVGITMRCRVADSVKKGQAIAVIHYNDARAVESVLSLIKDAIHIGPSKPTRNTLIYAKVDARGVILY